MDVREAELAALEAEGEAFVVDAHQVHDGGLEVVDVDLVLHGVEAEFIALAMRDAGFDAATGHPDGESVGMMIAAPLLGVGDVALKEGRSAEFTTPDDERVFQQAALLEVFDQRGTRRINIGALDLELRVQIAMLVPTGVHELHKAHAALGEAAGHQAIVGVAALAEHIGAIHVEDALRLVR